MKKETTITIKDGDYEQHFVVKDAKHAFRCIHVFLECDFEVTIKLRDQKE